MKTLIFALFAAVTLPAHGIILSYNYDAAGRLNAVNYNGTSRTAYGYDKNGNLLSRTDTTNPIPPMAGVFNGLLSNASPDATNIGPITLKMGINGSFSGKVTLGATSHSFTGTFPANGVAQDITITRKLPLNNLTLTLTLDVAGGTQQITGSITGVDLTSDVVLDLAGYNTKTNPLPGGLAGKYTSVFLPTEATAGIPQGDGYATVNVSAAGVIMVAGKLANNVGITNSTPMVGVNSWPLFISLHAKKGYVAGNVTFESDPGTSDFDGFLTWVKPDTTGTFHPADFTTNLTFIGSKWDAPLKGQRALNFANAIPNSTFNASEGDLGAPIFVNITLDTANKFIIPAPTLPPKLKLTLTTTTGVVTGSFVDGTKTRTLGGVLIQEWNSGSGFFPGPTESGVFEIEPAP